MAIEFTAGVLSDSTALMADAGHNLSDVLGLAMAGGAAWLARRAAGAQKTYGYGKATVLAALFNALLLIFACGAIAFEAIRRLTDPAPVGSITIMVVAGIGFFINLGTALMFMKDQHKELNVRGAYLHMMADAGVSLGVVIAGAAIMFTDFSLIDPLVSLAIVVVIMWGTWGLLKDSVNLALDAAPRGVDVVAIRTAFLALPGVRAVHDDHGHLIEVEREAPHLAGRHLSAGRRHDEHASLLQSGDPCVEVVVDRAGSPGQREGGTSEQAAARGRRQFVVVGRQR